MSSLSLCMIVKNEEAVLERILKPISEIMDEILIADTGSSDRTKEIAEEFSRGKSMHGLLDVAGCG